MGDKSNLVDDVYVGSAVEDNDIINNNKENKIIINGTSAL